MFLLGLFFTWFGYSFAALAVLLDFLLQVTAFVALIVFDFLRSEDKRVDCFPCIKVSSYAKSDKGIDIAFILQHCNSFLLLTLYGMIQEIMSFGNLGVGQRKSGLLARYMKVIIPVLIIFILTIIYLDFLFPCN